MRIEFDYQPIRVHVPFHQSTAYERALFGGYGSGKSFALCAEALAFGLEQPGSEILICRKTIASLRDTTEAIFTSLIPSKLWEQCESSRMGGHYDSITLPNGTKYMFRGLDDWMKLKSLSVAGIFYDEVDEVDDETYVGLMSRVRQRRPTPKAIAQGAPEITRRVIVAASNPAGRNWVWKRFVSPADKAKNAEHFISTSLDNPHLPVAYIESLLDMPEPWIRRYVLCSFDEFAGQIYPDWNYATGVIRPLHPDDFRATGCSSWASTQARATRQRSGLWCYYDKEKARARRQSPSTQEQGLRPQPSTLTRGARSRASTASACAAASPTRRRSTVRDRGTNMGLEPPVLAAGVQLRARPERARTTRIHGARPAHLPHGASSSPTTAARLHDQLKQLPLGGPDAGGPRARGEERPSPLKKGMDILEATAQYVASQYVAPPKLQVVENAQRDRLVDARIEGRHPQADRAPGQANRDKLTRSRHDSLCESLPEVLPMGAERFFVSEINPNDQIGGGGCACSRWQAHRLQGALRESSTTPRATTTCRRTWSCRWLRRGDRRQAHTTRVRHPGLGRRGRRAPRLSLSL
jgi:hypothetical protein